MSSPRRNKKLGSSAVSADAVPASATSASATGDGASILAQIAQIANTTTLVLIMLGCEFFAVRCRYNC